MSGFDISEAIIVGIAIAYVNQPVETSIKALLKFHLTREVHFFEAA